MHSESLFESYYKNWLPLCPDAQKIMTLLKSRGEEIVNDHIALRTLDFEGMNVESLAEPFLKVGYEFKGDYHFEKKNLRARHLESTQSKTKVFISELTTSKISDQNLNILVKLKNHLTQAISNEPQLGTSGRHWEFSRETYKQLYQESEYAAWFYAFGFRANHFTILVNDLKSFGNLFELNSWLKQNGVELNTSGGEIKGEAAIGLAQSSTMAKSVPIATGHCESVPGCYIEFAERFPLSDGKLYNGFVTGSADKIFESTSAKTS